MRYSAAYRYCGNGEAHVDIADDSREHVDSARGPMIEVVAWVLRKYPDCAYANGRTVRP